MDTASLPRQRRKPTCIIYVRLSRADDLSTSIKSQTDACRAFALSQGWRVLFVADQDNGVSGASKLEDRPGMSKVLAALPEADYLLAVKVDRFARSLMEFTTLVTLTAEHGATLVTVDGTLSAATSGFMAKLFGLLAEFERDQIQARILAAKEFLRRVGRWMGGEAPYGYRLIKRDGGTYLEIDPEAAAVLRGVVEKLLAGSSLNAIVRALNESGTLSPADYARQRKGREVRGTQWSGTALRDILLSPAMRGHLVQSTPQPGSKRKRGAVSAVLDDKGNPQQVGPELIDADTHDAVKTVLAGRAAKHRTTGQRAGKAPLLHIATCAECGGHLYHRRRMDGDKDRSRYTCQHGARGGHVAVEIQARKLEALVEDAFLGRFGRFNMLREVVAEGRDVSREIRETEAAIDSLADSLPALPAGGRAAQRVTGQLAELEAKLVVLEAAQREQENPVVSWVPTGRTIAEEYAARDTDGRRELLEAFGVRAVISPSKGANRFDPSRADVRIGGPAWVRENDPATAELIAVVMDEMDIDPATAEQIVTREAVAA
ncbi:recombinase family protein [Streptomyces sp. NPDC059928]|uniref:recombinase family protein n=1 Tax=unclassified Streptomyces TaxID=2593676 RepID=UPI00365C9A18